MARYGELSQRTRRQDEGCRVYYCETSVYISGVRGGNWGSRTLYVVPGCGGHAASPVRPSLVVARSARRLRKGRTAIAPISRTEVKTSLA